MNSLAKEFILIRRNSGFIENLLVVCDKVCIVVKEEIFIFAYVKLNFHPLQLLPLFFTIIIFSSG